jgi:hypothetical protein
MKRMTRLQPIAVQERRRIGRQFIRCDTLTGAGTTAPTWIPQVRPRGKSIGRDS